MTKKGATQRPWTTYELALLRKCAGVIPTDEIAISVGRSKRSVETQAQRMGLSLAVNKWTLEWCVECANWRTRLNARTGRCRVCTLRENLRNEEGRCADVLARMTPEQREIYDGNETRRERRKPWAHAPKYPQLHGLTRAEKVKALHEYAVDLEEFQAEITRLRYDATRTRLKRMRAVLGENPRKNKN